jgi:zinc and cadmium transporter
VRTWTWSLLSVLAVCLLSLAGVAALSLSGARLRRLAAALVSFAVGALLGDAFIHLIPEAFAGGARPLRPSLSILGGMLLFFVVEKLLRHHHGSLHHHANHVPDDGRRHLESGRPELASINLIGDAIHNFIDGALIAASYMAGSTLGVSTTLAVVCHELPQELGDFGVLVHSGLRVRQAIVFNLASASLAVLGAVLTLSLGPMTGTVTELLLPVTAGGFVYIAAADLIPDLQHDRSLAGLLAQASLITAGITVMGLLTLVD